MKKNAFATSLVVLSSILVSGCTQLPQRTDYSTLINQVPNFQSNSVISAENGLVSDGIAKLPGAICVPGPNGKCDAQHISPTQCLSPNSSVDVKPNTNPTPTYHSLIDNNYSAAITLPFISPTASAEDLKEIKAVISGTAQIANMDASNGYPGAQRIKDCVLEAFGPGDYPTVYWISSANIITVTTTNFKHVDSSLDVKGTGFGANGKTYNHGDEDAQSIWVTLWPRPVNVGHVQQPVAGDAFMQPGLKGHKPTVPETAPQAVKFQVFDIDAHGMLKGDKK